jgi:hypothetical protein
VLLLFKQLIRFVNGDIRSFFFARADCRTKGGYAIISRPDIATVKDLKGKRLAINTFRQLGGFRDLPAAQPQWSHPTKM